MSNILATIARGYFDLLNNLLIYRNKPCYSTQNLQFSTLYHINEHQNKSMMAKSQEEPSLLEYTPHFSCKLHSHVPPSLCTWVVIGLIFWVGWTKLSHDFLGPLVYQVVCEVDPLASFSIIHWFTWIAKNQQPIRIVVVSRHWDGLASLNPLEWVVSIHGVEHTEFKFFLAFKLVGTRWTDMAESPVFGITSEGFLSEFSSERLHAKIEVIGDWKLPGDVRFKGHWMEVANRFDKGMDGNVWATIVRNSIELKTVNGKSNSWQKGSTRDKAIFNDWCHDKGFPCKMGNGGWVCVYKYISTSIKHCRCSHT